MNHKAEIIIYSSQIDKVKISDDTEYVAAKDNSSIRKEYLKSNVKLGLIVNLYF